MKNNLLGSMKIKSKKAQVTIFIIIAIVIVALIILFFLLRGDKISSDIESEQDKLSLVPGQVRPVYAAIDTSLKEIVKNGLEILRLQGGYIYLPNDILVLEIETSGKHVINSQGDIRLVEGDGKTKIPVWLDKTSMAVPSLDYMEEQLEVYIKSELLKLDLSEFEQRGMNLSFGKIQTDVSLGDNVLVDVDWPISINYKEQSYEFREFSQKAFINFTQIFDIASSLVIYELAYDYLENHAKSLISLYSYAGGNKIKNDLPPFIFTDTNLDCNFVTWSKPEVESSLKEIFSENYNFLKMDKTNFERIRVPDPIAQGVYDSFIYDYFPEMNNIHIDFSYAPAHDLDLSLSPENLIPERVSQSKIPFLPSFCTFKYKFYYTLSPPVIVKIKDDRSAAFSSQGYEFYFPMKLYLCNNGERECREISDQEIDIAALEELTGEKFYDCKDIERKTTITVEDFSGNKLDSADITHFCEGYSNNCWLGRTQNGNIEINLPKCNNPTLTIQKQGHQSITDIVKSKYILEQLRNFTVDVKIVDAKKFAAAYYLSNGFTKSSCGKTPQTLLQDSVYDVTAKDNVLFSVSGANNILISYPTTNKIEFAGGNYKISSIVNSKVKIYPSNYNGKYISFNTEDNTKPYDGQWLLGAAEHDFLIQSSELTGKNKITFYALVEHLSTEELEVNDFDNPLITASGLSGEIEADENCDGIRENHQISISKQSYSDFIKPKFTSII